MYGDFFITDIFKNIRVNSFSLLFHMSNNAADMIIVFSSFGRNKAGPYGFL